MADKQVTELDPVTTPAATDLFGCRQTGDAEDKGETRLQLHTLEVGEHFVLPLVDEVATPTLAFGDGDSGWYERIDDEINMSIAGVRQIISAPDGKLFINTLTGIGAAGGNISSTTPGLVSIYGAGFDGNGQAGDVEIWGGYAAGTTSAAIGGNLILWGGSGGGDDAQGGNAFLIGGFGDVDPGFAEVRGGIATTGGNGGDARILGGAGVAGNNLGGDVVLQGGAGAGSGADGKLLFNSIIEYQADVGLTAHVGSSQGDGPITSQYNVYSTVANAGDAATLTTTFGVGHVIYIKNDDSTNSMDVFPASGDNLGNGVNVAEAVAAGDYAVFMGTVANLVWTKLMGGTA